MSYAEPEAFLTSFISPERLYKAAVCKRIKDIGYNKLLNDVGKSLIDRAKEGDFQYKHPAYCFDHWHDALAVKSFWELAGYTVHGITAEAFKTYNTSTVLEFTISWSK